MKKIVYALVLAILLPLFSANAEKLSVSAQINNNPLKNVKVTKEMLLSPRTDMMSNKYSNTLQANEYFTKPGIGTPAGWWIGYASATTPMAYDPESGILIYSTYTTGDKGIGANPPLYCTINLFWTTDMGANWNRDSLGSFTDEILVAPSIGVTNSGNAQNVSELNIVNFSRYAAKSGEEFPWAGGYYQWNNKGSYDSWPSSGPDQGENASFYMWPTSDLAVYNINSQTAGTAVGVLSQKPNTLAKYGIYGQASLNIDSFDNMFSLPNEWSGSNFWLIDNFNSSYNSRMMVDADNSGNVYSCVFNYCVNNDLDSTRTPAVSKSTDGGLSWSTFNLCPAKVIENYMLANDLYYRVPEHPDVSPEAVGRLVNFHRYSEYTKNAFVVTANNEYSFVTPMYVIFLRNDSLLGKVRMVEIYYKNNTWGVNTIADLKYWSAASEAYQVNDANGNKMYDTVDVNLDGYEVLAAKTADGNDIVCTWVANSKIFVFNPPVQTTIGNIDSLLTTDIFGGVRALSGSAWTSAQFTDDDHYNKMTRMPKVVPNRNSIPVVAHDSRFSTQETVWTTYPVQFQNMNYRTFQSFYLMNFDFSNPKKYITGVEDQPVVNFTLNAPVPNPSNGLTELTFNMNEGAFTSIAVYNAMGAKVADLQSGYTTEGVHGLNINTESYVSGVYYIVLTAGSNSATTLLNVVR